MSETARGPQPSVLIVGASTRAAAQSAIRAGLVPICADLFADLDLRACAQVLDVPDYPQGLAAAAARVTDCPWMYTGGIENHPDVIAWISETRRLWGNGPEVVRRVRDPWLVGEMLAQAGLPALHVWPRESPAPAADGTWMLRPLRGSAGRGIRLWESDARECATLREAHYFQQRIGGESVSALFLSAPEQTHLLAVTRQLIGLKEVNAPPFAWCGTITPIDLPERIVAGMRRTGEVVAAQAGLRGLFGCDFLVEGGQAWLTEVNPRYPASTELVEYVFQAPLLDWHRRVFDGQFVVPPSGGFRNAPPEGGTTNAQVFGKIILYADRDMVATDVTRFVSRPLPWLTSAAHHDDPLPSIADIPVPGQAIGRGEPICTLFADASSEEECLVELIRRAERLERTLR
jgi:predicted ATP-grasp superfamily ATP-dependent carboligase